MLFEGKDIFYARLEKAILMNVDAPVNWLPQIIKSHPSQTSKICAWLANFKTVVQHII